MSNNHNTLHPTIHRKHHFPCLLYKRRQKNSWARKTIVGLIISIVAAIITLAVLTVCLSYFIYTLYHPPALQKAFNQSSSSSASNVAQQIYFIKIWLVTRF